METVYVVMSTKMDVKDNPILGIYKQRREALINACVFGEANVVEDVDPDTDLENMEEWHRNQFDYIIREETLWCETDHD